MLSKLRRRQRGQAAIFVFLFLTIIVVSMLTLYKAGKLTSDKMQLQNAADATAYSASLIEARDLNFAAYMNRAIIANEVAVGQLTGMASWAIHFQSFADWMRAYDLAIIGPATLGISTPIINSIAGTWNAIIGTGVKIMSKIANFGTIVLHNINKAYGLAQYGYHTVSVIFVVGVLDENIKQNAPPGAKMSDFGIMSMIAHILTYGALPALPGTNLTEGYVPFTQGYSPTKKVRSDAEPENLAATPKGGKKQKATVTGEGFEAFSQGGYGRLAALINEGRDPFTTGRGWELRPPGFPVDITVGETIDFGIAEAGFELRFHFDLSLERKGGSELRILFPTQGNKKKTSGTISGRNANWSAADTTGLFFEIGGGFDIFINTALGDASIGGDIALANSRLKIAARLLGFDINVVNVPFPTSAPFGSGFAQVGKTGSTAIKSKLDAIPGMTLDPAGPIQNEHYGEAAKNLPAWVSPGSGVPGGPNFPVPLGVQFAASPPYDLVSRVNKSYGGLPHYVDTTGNTSFLGIGAPNFVVGLVLDEPDFDRANDGSTEKEPLGRFAITEDLADNELAVISKSEVYFSRPTNLEYFVRFDGQEEFGNAFNPFWQARLVETSYADRVLSLLVQQKQDWINLGATINLAFNDLMSLIR